MSKYISFVNKRASTSGKTSIYDVMTNDDEFKLGEIRWLGRWRQYAFFPTAETVYEKTCLGDIREFLLYLMKERDEEIMR